MLNTRVSTLLGIKYPIIQAPLSWITSAEMVAAVSNAGGLGVLGPRAGQNIISHDPIEITEQFRREIRKTKSLTTAPFAVNYIFPTDTRSTQLSELLFNVICEEQVKIVITVVNELTQQDRTITKFKDKGITVIHRNLSPTIENSIYAAEQGIDSLIITGHESGGTLSNTRVSTLSLLPQITEILEIPLIAAGGIYNGKTAKAAFAMGAEAVFMGTRFINSIECPASDLCKNEIIRVKSEELLEVRVGNYNTRVTAALNPSQNYDYLTSYKIGMLDGNLNKGFVSVSESAGGIKNILSCQQIIDEIVGSLKKSIC